MDVRLLRSLEQDGLANRVFFVRDEGEALACLLFQAKFTPREEGKHGGVRYNRSPMSAARSCRLILNAKVCSILAHGVFDTSAALLRFPRIHKSLSSEYRSLVSIIPAGMTWQKVGNYLHEKVVTFRKLLWFAHR